MWQQGSGSCLAAGNARVCPGIPWHTLASRIVVTHPLILKLIFAQFWEIADTENNQPLGKPPGKPALGKCEADF